MISSRSKKPFINIWFGNFYCPAYDNKDFVDQMMGQIAQLGFTDVMLDAKTGKYVAVIDLDTIMPGSICCASALTSSAVW